VTLFSPNDLRSRRRSLDRDQRSRRSIPTGPPRLIESSTKRLARADAKSWDRLVEALRQASVARLELLKNRQGSDRTPCPWARLVDCNRACRCGGAGTVTVEFLRDHYTRLPAEITKIAKFTSVRRPPS